MTDLKRTHSVNVILAALIILSAACSMASAAPGRWEQEISGEGWRLWLDTSAVWYDDEIYLPPVDVSRLPVNPPTCGWDGLEEEYFKAVRVPGTVEEHYWGAIGGAIPDVGGDYRGVSWWSTMFTLDPDLRGKRILIDFESVNLRAEVFVNRKLVGYDVIGNTPFQVDATEAVVFDRPNRINVRITDPVGNFSWNDNILMRWGENLIPAVHGFGGITGPVVVKAVDEVDITDIYVQNQPDPKKVKVFVTLRNTAAAGKGDVTLAIHEWKNPAAEVWRKSRTVDLPSGETVVEFSASPRNVKLWELAGHTNLKQAHLYEASVTFEDSGSGAMDAMSRRFGFRFFTVGEKNGDKRFYLNGKRVLLIAAMTRGFWPKNGIFATPEMAERDMETLVDMGFNMMLLHRAIGQPPVMDYADRMGLMTYEEPGGFMVLYNREDDIDGPDEQALLLRREKLRRMVIRDRSCPSMMIYNLKNEARKAPTEDDTECLRMVHELDPSRIITYNSDRNREIDWNEKVDPDPFKQHMLPFEDEIRYRGWWDHHHWFAWAGHVDFNYENPRFYLRGVINGPTAPARSDSLLRLDESEIIFWGEEGAFGTMVRLGKIHDRLMAEAPTGFREMEHIDWYNAYNEFLDETGFRAAYPTVDDLTMSLGRNLHYFHGRNLENVRMSNIADGYNLNGWASASTRTDVVDMYRNPTADPSILRYYTQPLYVAVKLRDKVLPAGSVPVADFWLINENDLKGKAVLEVRFEGPGGVDMFGRTYDVSVLGGEEFGQLLLEGVEFPAISATGYYTVRARIVQDGTVRATGFDDIFAVTAPGSRRVPGSVAVMEHDGAVAGWLGEIGGSPVRSYSKGMADADCIIVGSHEFDDGDTDIFTDILDRVENGATLIVLEGADEWAGRMNERLRRKPPVYQGEGIVRFGNRGRLFTTYSPYLSGLPQGEGMNWEYQCFYQTGNVSGLDLHPWGCDFIVCMAGQHTKDILTSLSRTDVGEGQVILSTLNIIPELDSHEPQAAVAKNLLLNLIEYSRME